MFQDAGPRKRRWNRRSDLERLSRALVTLFGIGYLPLAPGTWGSAATVLFFLVLHLLEVGHSNLLAATLAGVLLFPAIVLSGRFANERGRSDPSEIVIDEVLGQCVCLALVPVTVSSLVVGFFLFRGFDIWKPFPIRSLERLPGGTGIVCDDLAAGVYAGVGTNVLLWLLAG